MVPILYVSTQRASVVILCHTFLYYPSALISSVPCIHCVGVSEQVRTQVPPGDASSADIDSTPSFLLGLFAQ